MTARPRRFPGGRGREAPREAAQPVAQPVAQPRGRRPACRCVAARAGAPGPGAGRLDGCEGRRADPEPGDGRPLPQALRRVRRRALPDRRGLRAGRPAAAGSGDAPRGGRDPAGAGRGERHPGGDRRALARRRGRGRIGWRRHGGAALAFPAGGCRVGAGERRGVRAGPGRLQGLRHRQRPQAAAQRPAHRRRGAADHGLPLPLQGRGLVADKLPPRLLPGVLDPRRRPGAAAGRHLGAALRARAARPGRRPPVRPPLLPGPARRGDDAGAPRLLGRGGGAVRRDPHGDAGRDLHRRARGRRQVDHHGRQPRAADGRDGGAAQPGDAGGPRSSTASPAQSRSRCRRRAPARPGPGTTSKP